MSIGIANVNDVPALVDLVHSGYRGEGSKRGWTSEADILDGTRTSDELLIEIINSQNSVILKYTEDGKVIGCVELEKVVKKGELKCYTGLLTVSPELQGKGIGKKMLKASEEWAKSEGCVALTMVSSP
jgi:N-acetylglutamate synthase-like GNAT family acetyltransferase